MTHSYDQHETLNYQLDELRRATARGLRRAEASGELDAPRQRAHARPPGVRWAGHRLITLGRPLRGTTLQSPWRRWTGDRLIGLGRLLAGAAADA